MDDTPRAAEEGKAGAGAVNGQRMTAARRARHLGIIRAGKADTAARAIRRKPRGQGALAWIADSSIHHQSATAYQATRRIEEIDHGEGTHAG